MIDMYPVSLSFLLSPASISSIVNKTLSSAVSSREDDLVLGICSAKSNKHVQNAVLFFMTLCLLEIIHSAEAMFLSLITCRFLRIDISSTEFTRRSITATSDISSISSRDAKNLSK